jgi:hypothetical protein
VTPPTGLTPDPGHTPPTGLTPTGGGDVPPHYTPPPGLPPLDPPGNPSHPTVVGGAIPGTSFGGNNPPPGIWSIQTSAPGHQFNGVNTPQAPGAWGTAQVSSTGVVTYREDPAKIAANPGTVTSSTTTTTSTSHTGAINPGGHMLTNNGAFHGKAWWKITSETGEVQTYSIETRDHTETYDIFYNGQYYGTYLISADSRTEHIGEQKVWVRNTHGNPHLGHYETTPAQDIFHISDPIVQRLAGGELSLVDPTIAADAPDPSAEHHEDSATLELLDPLPDPVGLEGAAQALAEDHQALHTHPGVDQDSSDQLTTADGLAAEDSPSLVLPTEEPAPLAAAIVEPDQLLQAVHATLEPPVAAAAPPLSPSSGDAENLDHQQLQQITQSFLEGEHTPADPATESSEPARAGDTSAPSAEVQHGAQEPGSLEQSHAEGSEVLDPAKLQEASQTLLSSDGPEAASPADAQGSSPVPEEIPNTGLASTDIAETDGGAPDTQGGDLPLDTELPSAMPSAAPEQEDLPPPLF